jgi:hypothetical protein
MARCRPLFFSAAALLLLGGAHRALAQIEVTPRVGAYLPMGTLLAETDSASGATVKRRQVGTLLVGVGLSAGLSERIGLQAAISLAPSQIAITTTRSTRDVGAAVVLGNLRGIYYLTPRSGRLGLHVGTGIGLIERLGGPWRDVAGTTDLGLASSIGGRGGVVDGIRYTFELEHYMTWVGFNDVEPVSETSGRIHHDVLLSLGLVITVADR